MGPGSSGDGIVPRHRRVRLASGHEIRVLAFNSLAPAEGLHKCPSCHGDLVQPLDWTEVGTLHWRVLLRCPECWWQDEAHHPQPVMEAYDRELDRGADVLVRALRSLAVERMQEDCDRFLVALERDAVLPEDF